MPPFKFPSEEDSMDDSKFDEFEEESFYDNPLHSEEHVRPPDPQTKPPMPETKPPVPQTKPPHTEL